MATPGVVAEPHVVSQPGRPGGAYHLAAPYLRSTLKLVTGAGLLFLVYMWCQYFWYEGFEKIYGASMARLGLVYTYGAGLDPPVKSLDMYDSFYILFLWVPLGGGALFMILAQRLPNQAKPGWMRRTQALGRRVMQYQLPPHGFWIKQTGGMSVLDILMLVIVLLLNLMWFCVGMKNFNDEHAAMRLAGIRTVEEVWQLRLEWAGLYFGVLLFIDVWLLLLPIPQSSFLQDLSGMDYHQMIRWHRWMGHITMIVTTMHGLLYFIFWGITHQFWTMFTDWSEDSSINYLAGSISWFFGLALWLTSMEWCRRGFWEVYYRFHIVCFFGFMFFAYIHYSGSWIYFSPGLLLWFIDLVLRAGSYPNTTTVANCGVSASEEVVTLQIQASKRARGCPLHDIYLLFPTISRWQWHPFTISHQSPDGVLTVRIKRFGGWTESLLNKLKNREPLPIRASCPQYNAPHRWRQDEVAVVLAGGIASTAVLSVLSDLVARRAQGKATGPHRVFFVWAARHAVEFCVLDLSVAAASMSSDGWLSTSLFYTGKEPLLAANQHEKLDSLEKVSSRGSESGSEPRAGGAAKAKPLTFPRASPFRWNRARRMQPQTTGPWHLAIVTGLVFFGGFVGQALSYTWYGEWQTHYQSLGEALPYNPFFWKQAAVNCIVFCVIGLGFPFLVAVFLPNLYRYWRDTRAGSTGEEQMAAFDGVWDPSSMGCELQGQEVVIPGSEAGIPIASGRPDIVTVLQGAAKETGARHIGVYVAGPEPMSRDAQIATCQLNSTKGGAFFDFHKMAGLL
ncbi:FRE1C [Auxenochlorella protothecoides x Auxenochlorella symbiontica]